MTSGPTTTGATYTGAAYPASSPRLVHQTSPMPATTTYAGATYKGTTTEPTTTGATYTGTTAGPTTTMTMSLEEYEEWRKNTGASPSLVRETSPVRQLSSMPSATSVTYS